MISLNFGSELSQFLLQVVIILSLSKTISYLISFIKQPVIIGELLTRLILGTLKIKLGPTFLSKFPLVKEFVFPVDSIPRLELVADFGLILYIFMVGLELDPEKVLSSYKKYYLVSILGIVFPFLAALGFSYLTYNLTEQSVPFM